MGKPPLTKRSGFAILQLFLFTVLPVLVTAWFGVVLAPMDVEGHWDARDPRNQAWTSIAKACTG